MKYKLQIEFDYTDLDRDQIRDFKLELLSNDLTTSIESDYPLHIPNKDDIIDISGDECTIRKISHSISKEYYTTTISVVNKVIEDILYKNKKEQLDQQQKAEMELFRKKLLMQSRSRTF